MGGWLESGEELHAPWLALYEVTNGLTRLVAHKHIHRGAANQALRAILDLPITYHPAVRLSERALEVALLLQRANAYDAFYIALAESWIPNCGPSTES